MRGALLLKLPSDDAEVDAKLASILLPQSVHVVLGLIKRF